MADAPPDVVVKKSPPIRNAEEKRGWEAIDPFMRYLLTVDWESPNILENEVAVATLEGIIQRCKPCLLQFMLKKIEERIRNDFDLFIQMEEWLKVLRQMKELGDEIYT